MTGYSAAVPVSSYLLNVSHAALYLDVELKSWLRISIHKFGIFVYSILPLVVGKDVSAGIHFLLPF